MATLHFLLAQSLALQEVEKEMEKERAKKRLEDEEEEEVEDLRAEHLGIPAHQRTPTQETWLWAVTRQHVDTVWCEYEEEKEKKEEAEKGYALQTATVEPPSWRLCIFVQRSDPADLVG